jgi:hypothetical protein
MADTPDQRPDDTTLDLDRSELPPDLLPLHERLVADGARWRRRAPDGRDLPAWARVTLVAAPSTAESANGGLRERRLDAHDEHLSRPKGPHSLMDSSNTSTRARWRAFAGAAAATIVVGLLAALLAHNAALRGAGGSASAPSTPPTPTPCPSQPPETPLLPNGCPAATPGQQPVFLQPGDLPVVAPGDPQTVYRVANFAVQRSTDGGKTFTATTQPKTGLSRVDYTGIAVSPLDVNTVFFSAGGLKNDQGCPPPQSYGALALTQHGGILASGFIPCSAQLMSRDGGQTWRKLSLPTGGVLGGTAGFRSMRMTEGAQQYTIQAQEQRLYSAIAFANMGGSLVDSLGARLVASDDGGVTWKLIDDALVRTGHVVCDFAASPSGKTVYATTSPGGCAAETFPTISLWRSDDGGLSWQGLGHLPTLEETGMVVSHQGWLYIYTPDVTVQGHGASETATPASAIVSQDGGAHFTHAPTANLPPKDGLLGPFATLSDGSVIYQLQTADPAGSSGALYSWKPGASAWTKLSDTTAGVAAVIVAQLPAGGDRVTVIGNDGAVTSFDTPS